MDVILSHILCIPEANQWITAAASFLSSQADCSKVQNDRCAGLGKFYSSSGEGNIHKGYGDDDNDPRHAYVIGREINVMHQ